MISMHSFDPDIAEQVGINAAVIYQNIVWWCDKNAGNGKHFHEGRYWTYNSVKAFAVLFPYLTRDQIRRALEKLVSEGLILVGSFNETGYDRTHWYAPSCQIDLADLPSPFGKIAKPIPDSKTVGKHEREKRALPDDWIPAQFGIGTKSRAIVDGWDADEHDRRVEHFKAHHRKKGDRFADWQAAWSTWVLNNGRFSNGGTNRTGGAKGRSSLARAIDEGLAHLGD